jgi:hypothetical protein
MPTMPTWEEICGACRVAGAIPVTFEFLRNDDGRGAFAGAFLLLKMDAPDVISGTMKTIVRQVHVPDITMFRATEESPAKQMARILCQHAIDLYVHEAKEQFRYREERPFIPHHEH